MRDPVAPRDRLRTEPGRFDLDQGIAVAAHGADARDVVFRSTPDLGYAAAPIAQADPDTRRLQLSTFGLTGPGGVLPRHHTAMLAAELRARGHGLHAFLDMLGGRFAALWAKAGAKYRPTRDPAPAERALAAAAGLYTGHLEPRSGVPRNVALFHAGNLASRTRSAERLRALLEAEVGEPVEIVEFAGGWLRLSAQEQTRLGAGGPGRRATGQHAALGVSAMMGSQVWDASARFVVRVGPVRRATFDALLPGRALHGRIVALTRLVVGLDTGFAINPVLAAEDVPALTLSTGDEAGRLGWVSWTSMTQARRGNSSEAMFEVR